MAAAARLEVEVDRLRDEHPRHGDHGEEHEPALGVPAIGARSAHNLGGRSGSTPRFPKTLWEIVKTLIVH